MKKLLVVGGGKMGEALVSGLLATHWAEPRAIAIVEKNSARWLELEELFPGIEVLNEIIPAHGAIIAVKPNDVCNVLTELCSQGITRVLSVAAGITLQQLSQAATPETALVRCMPNTPALIGAGASAIAGREGTDESTMVWAEEILSSVGTVVRVGEYLLDAVTGLSGSGPAYVFLFAESLVEAGVLAGLPRDIAETLAFQTLLGASRMLTETGQSAADLRAAVTSPGGTTAAGLQQLEERGMRASVLSAVQAAKQRSIEMGK